MTRNLTLLILSLLFFQTAKAQKTTDTVLYYMKNSGVSVSTKDSADYLRSIISPQSNTDKGLFKVRDYYPNGKLKMVATSLNDKIPLSFDGTITNYFPNGKRQSTLEYINGNLSGIITTYYPNGELFTTLKVKEDGQSNDSLGRVLYVSDKGRIIFDNDFKDILEECDTYYPKGELLTTSQLQEYNQVSLIECRDSTGNILAVNGTGHLIVFDDDFKKTVGEGDIKDGIKDGEWHGLIADSGRYVSIFRRGVFKSGTSYMKSGKQYTFNKVVVEPEFEGGMPYLYIYLTQKQIYPEYAKEHNINGTVRVNFIIEKDGSVTNVKLADTESPIPSLEGEAIRLINAMPAWKPGKIYGIPMRFPYTIPVDFSQFYVQKGF
jgi:TonB family protein